MYVYTRVHGVQEKREVLVVTLCMQDVLSNWMRNAIPDFEIC